MSFDSINTLLPSILSLLNYKDFCSFEESCKMALNASKDVSIWEVFFDRESHGLYSEFVKRKWTTNPPTKELFIAYFKKNQATINPPLQDPVQSLTPFPGSLSEFQIYCQKGDLERIQEIDSSRSLGVNDYPHCMPYACLSGNVAVVHYLRSKLKYPQWQLYNSKCFIAACRSDNSALAKEILDKLKPENHSKEDMLAVLSTKCSELVFAFLKRIDYPQESLVPKSYPQEFNFYSYDEKCFKRLSDLFASLKSST